MEKTKPVLVVGATGSLGTEICRQLIAANRTVRGLVRTTSNPAKVNALRNMGVETIEGDIKDRASLMSAMENIEEVISTVSSTMSRIEGDNIETVDRIGQLNVVEAADNSGVNKFVFISFLDTPEKFPLQDAKREVERRLMQSNMDYTVLRPTFFMEVWLGAELGFDVHNNKATVYGHGANKISWISLKDVASFAVSSLDNEEAINNFIDLGGPEALSPLEVIKIAEERTGRNFLLQYIPEEALRMQKENSQDSLQQSFAALMLTYASGAEVPMEDTLQFFQLKLKSVREYIHSLLEAELHKTELL
jgi:uncharacterized protein YbjT (DUF2867 family)